MAVGPDGARTFAQTRRFNDRHRPGGVAVPFGELAARPPALPAVGSAAALRGSVARKLHAFNGLLRWALENKRRAFGYVAARRHRWGCILPDLDWCSDPASTQQDALRGTAAWDARSGPPFGAPRDGDRGRRPSDHHPPGGVSAWNHRGRHPWRCARWGLERSGAPAWLLAPRVIGLAILFAATADRQPQQPQPKPRPKPTVAALT